MIGRNQGTRGSETWPNPTSPCRRMARDQAGRASLNRPAAWTMVERAEVLTSHRVLRLPRNMGVLQAAIAALVITFLPATAWAQRVTKVPDGDTLVVDGVGRVHLLGIKSADGPALQLGPSGPPPEPRQDPGTPAPAAVSGRISLPRDRPSRDFLRKLVLGKTVRIEYDPLAGSSGDRGAYLFLEDGTLLNAEMLKAGRARIDVTRQFVRELEFKRLEEEAQSASVGIWIR